VRRVRGFLAFVYDFVVGDDWRIAIAVVVGLALTALLAAHDVVAWWVMPLVVVLALGGSLWRAGRAAVSDS
jgi:large-conductance mechanosensitive channel